MGWMKKIGRLLRQVFQFWLAMVVSFFIVNAFMNLYFRSSGFVKRSTNATSALSMPDSTYVMGYEGYAINRTDSNGYFNRTSKLQEDYILVMGSSQTEGMQVGMDETYISILNDFFQCDEKAKVYSIARAGVTWPDIVSGFTSALAEFPGAESVIIQVGQTDFETEVLGQCVHQREYNVSLASPNVFQSMSVADKAKVFLEKNLPLLYYIYDIQLKGNKVHLDGAFGIQFGTEAEDVGIDLEEYRVALEQNVKLLRSEFEGKIIVFYLPQVKLLEDGRMQVLYEDTYPVFESVCVENGITVFDMGDDYQKNYGESQVVPYGFWNTSMGSGHLNENGHQMIAEHLAHILQP